MAQASHLHGRIASSAIGALGANLLIFEGGGGGAFLVSRIFHVLQRAIFFLIQSTSRIIFFNVATVFSFGI